MAQRQLSRTLPKNFTFPSLMADEPKTPERELTPLDVPPPPPPRHSFSSCRLPRVRVRAGTDVCERINLDLFRFQGSRVPQDVPIPSIEYSRGSSPLDATCSDDLIKDHRYLAPPRQRLVFKTPPAQIRGPPVDSDSSEQMWSSWDETPGLVRGESTRRASVCSDSSCESIETLASRPSVGGSCTSLESEVEVDHRLTLEMSKSPGLESPILPESQHLQRSQVKDKLWTREMDNHLWNTYQLYLQDPTITPFKRTPGSIPPLGVTAKVARRARRTWDTKRLSFAQALPTQSNNRSGSSTPRARESSVQPTWPRSDAKTRRRLKHLCRRKFCISPHYHRLMQSRSPEPVVDTLSVPSESRIHDCPENTNAYATRDLGISLVPTYHADVFAEFVEGPAPAETEPKLVNTAISPGSLPAPPVPQIPSQHSPFPTMKIDDLPPRLGSPFTYSTWGPGAGRLQVADLAQSARRETIHVPNRRLRRTTHLGNIPMHPDDVFSSDVMSDEKKANAEDEDNEVQNRLEFFLRENKFQSIGKGRVRVRNRGATTSGPVPPRDIDQLFSPPSSLISQTEETTPMSKPPVNSLLNLNGDNIKRLGSPFRVETAFKRREAPGRVIRHAPSLSEPFAGRGMAPHVDRSNDLSAFSAQAAQEESTAPGPQNLCEDQLSDAERIRRQLLNLTSARK